MKHSKARFSGGCSWKSPNVLIMNVSLSLIYVVGLLLFQKYTGLLSDKQNVSTFLLYSSSSSSSYSFPLSSSSSFPLRHLLSAPNNNNNNNNNVSSTSSTNTQNDDPLFPEGFFDKQELKDGAVTLYIIGLVYTFVALAIVCDEFFVPSLDVIIEVIGCSEDVAGATFMAAGGSAPELFTSVIGVFVAYSNVGIGTIVGSAVFNILFVIGMCALFSKTTLYLTWWPLFRDCTFYSIALIAVIIFFLDEKITWYEAALLLGIYFAYVLFMKYNSQLERGVKRLLYKNKVTRIRSTDHLVPSPGMTGIAMSGTLGAGDNTKHLNSMPLLHSGSHFRHGLLQLMIHTIDPLHDGKVDDKAAQLHAIASLKVLLDATKPQEVTTESFDVPEDSGKRVAGSDGGTTVVEQDKEDENRPLDFSWPDSWRERITYIVILPILLPLWLTLPDTRKPSARKYYPLTFMGSILWIAIFSYLMVWWATVTGDTFGIPVEVMGLTFLAAGTSIPDLITSVIVARKGFGDMAVSSSVGSNIFDVTVGLPLPWLLYTMVFQKSVKVSSAGMVCSIAILFSMLLLVFFSIVLFNWKMTKGMGITMFLFYFVFVAITLGFEYDLYACPL